jgi:Ca-activated chloride channel family protein
MEYKSLWMALIGLIALILWSLEFWKVFKKAELLLPSGVKTEGHDYKRMLLFGIGVVAWLLISFSLTGPRKPLKFSPNNIEVNDIYFVVDVSRSMLAEDLQPNRLEVAKLKLREFASLRPTDRIGIIIFSEKVFTLLPLTTDPGLIDQVLSDIKIGYLGSGTNIGDALALAVARGQASETKNKVIILLTDGVNNVGNMTPLKSAELAAEFEMKVYTIGLGSNKDAKLPVGKGIFGKRYQNMPGGAIDIETLQKISEKTGGRTYMASSEESLNEILTDIQKLEKTKIKSQGQVVYDELFFPYLLWGILLFVLVEISRKIIIREIN